LWTLSTSTSYDARILTQIPKPQKVAATGGILLIPSSATAKEAILNTASGEPVTFSMPGDNIPELMGEDFSESVGDYISE